MDHFENRHVQYFNPPSVKQDDNGWVLDHEEKHYRVPVEDSISDNLLDGRYKIWLNCIIE
jgi:hypothetical protein